MSVEQIEAFLTPTNATAYLDAIGASGYPYIAYLVYDDYFNVNAFKAKVPNAQPVGFAFLRGWTWHLNTEGMSSMLRIVF
jgi:hypothetical protein